jgi:alpha-methylacyl-CoA racemase
VFEGSDACVTPVLPLAADHPHLVARGTFVDHDGVRQAAPAPRFDRTPTSLDRPPARPGQHTREALTDWGIADVDDLLDTGAAVQN